MEAHCRVSACENSLLCRDVTPQSVVLPWPSALPQAVPPPSGAQALAVFNGRGSILVERGLLHSALPVKRQACPGARGGEGGGGTQGAGGVSTGASDVGCTASMQGLTEACRQGALVQAAGRAWHAALA